MTNSRHKIDFLFILLFLVLNFEVFAQEDVHGMVLPELAGKWCLTNSSAGGTGTLTQTCITLNDDGTYEFTFDDAGRVRSQTFFPATSLMETDRGTWQVKADVLYYHSDARGDGYFKFQKMNQPGNETVPMVVVSGVPFVSASTHTAW